MRKSVDGGDSVKSCFARSRLSSSADWQEHVAFFVLPSCFRSHSLSAALPRAQTHTHVHVYKSGLTNGTKLIGAR